MSLVTRHLADNQQRHVTKLHLLASLDGESGNLLRLNLGDKLRNASRDLDAILLELALPERARQHRTAKLQLRRNVPRGRILMSARSDM